MANPGPLEFGKKCVEDLIIDRLKQPSYHVLIIEKKMLIYKMLEK